MPRGVYKRKAKVPLPPKAEPKPPDKPQPPKQRGYPAALAKAKEETVHAYETADALRQRIATLQAQLELSERSHLADREMVEQMQLKLKLITIFVDFVLGAKL